MSDRDDIITGQIVVRETGARPPDGSNRKLLMLVGVIAVPLDTPLEGENQYTVVGTNETLTVSLRVLKPGKDISAITLGNTLGQLVLEPIWRV
jgi:hypothetical protein